MYMYEAMLTYSKIMIKYLIPKYVHFKHFVVGNLTLLAIMYSRGMLI